MRKGFTLVELMLVVIIIGILVGMVVPRLTGRSQEARVAAAKADIYSNLSLALDLYELDNGRFPDEFKSLWENPKDTSKAPNWKGPYLKKYPPHDPWGNEYKYTIKEEGKEYSLISFGPDGQDSEDDISSDQKEDAGE